VYDERAGQGVGGVTLTWNAGGPASTNVTVTTDQGGNYLVRLADADAYTVSGGSVGSLSLVRPASPIDIANFYVNTGGCPTVYGRVLDAVTRRPVTGARLTWVGVTAASDVTGSYRLQLECRSGGYGSNTTVITVTHPDYATVTMVAGRGETLGSSPGEHRTDIALTPR
jgi:hypothetical protein